MNLTSGEVVPEVHAQECVTPLRDAGLDVKLPLVLLQEQDSKLNSRLGQQEDAVERFDVEDMTFLEER